MEWATMLAAFTALAVAVTQGAYWVWQRLNTEDEGHLVLDANTYFLILGDTDTPPKDWEIHVTWQGEGRCWDLEVTNPQGLEIHEGQPVQHGVLLPGDSLDIRLVLKEPTGSLDFRYRPHGSRQSRTDRIYLPTVELSTIVGSASWKHRARLARRLETKQRDEDLRSPQQDAASKS